jgi:hypothetical protein
MPDMKPRFTIRDLFWLVLVVALAMAWWIDRTHSIEHLKFEHDISAQKEAALMADMSKLRQWVTKQNREAAYDQMPYVPPR